MVASQVARKNVISILGSSGTLYARIVLHSASLPWPASALQTAATRPPCSCNIVFLDVWARHLILARPCTTDQCEQAHGSGSCLTKGHELYGEAVLRARCSLHQGRALVTQSSGDRFNAQYLVVNLNTMVHAINEWSMYITRCESVLNTSSKFTQT